MAIITHGKKNWRRCRLHGGGGHVAWPQRPWRAVTWREGSSWGFPGSQIQPSVFRAASEHLAPLVFGQVTSWSSVLRLATPQSCVHPFRTGPTKERPTLVKTCFLHLNCSVFFGTRHLGRFLKETWGGLLRGEKWWSGPGRRETGETKHRCTHNFVCVCVCVCADLCKTSRYPCLTVQV